MYIVHVFPFYSLHLVVPEALEQVLEIGYIICDLSGEEVDVRRQ